MKPSVGSMPRRLGAAALKAALFHPALVAAFGVVLVLWSRAQIEPAELTFDLDRPLEVEGWICTPPEIADGSVRFHLCGIRARQENRPVEVHGSLPIFLQDSTQVPIDPPLRFGESIAFTTPLRTPSHYLLPGVSDARLQAQLQGRPYHASLKSPLQLRRLGMTDIGRRLQPFFDYVSAFEAYCREALSPESAALVQAAFLGRKAALGQEKSSKVRALGLSHLFVVSGFHVTLLILFAGLAMGTRRPASAAALLLLVWLYVAAAGLGVSAVRAGIMNSMALVFLNRGLRGNLPNTIGVAALLLLALNPSLAFHPGFQLSFLCVLAIALLFLPVHPFLACLRSAAASLWSNRLQLRRDSASRFARRIRFGLEAKLEPLRGRRLQIALLGICWPLSYFLALAACSILISLSVLPVVTRHFHLFLTHQWLLNLFFVPAFSALLVCCLIAFLAYPFVPSGWAGVPLELIAGTINRGIETSSGWAASATHPAPEALILAIYYGLLLTPIALLPRRWKGLALIAPLALYLQGSLPTRHDPSVLEISLLDVGQGESIHLRYPSGASGLIDTGGLTFPLDNRVVGERLLAPYLAYSRVRSLQFVLLTHPHADHIQGYRTLVETTPIGQLYYSVPHDSYRPPMTRLVRGSAFHFSGVRHEVLHPAPEDLAALSPNDLSLVVRIEYGEFSFLATGDIESQVERRLARQGMKPVTILKAAHHGSSTSTEVEMLDALRPKAVLISAGRRSPLGHPSRQTLQRIRQAGVPYASTSERGTLRIRTDGNWWELQHFCERERRFLPIACGGG